MKLWEKQSSMLNKKIEKYTVGDDYLLDQKLVKYDCCASIAHAKMLQKIGILTTLECTKLTNTLQEIITLDSTGKFVIQQEEEDCHTAIENFLVNKLGDIGKKIHTARSRNDQVQTALRLYAKGEITAILTLIDMLITALEQIKDKYGMVEWPGFTHMRKAMPSSVGLWVDAFCESMDDNKALLLNIYQLIDQSPLGTGAGYGVPIDIDRKFTAQLLDFHKIQNNPLYVQNSRGKFEATILHGLSQIMLDLNKMASDLLLWSMPEFGFVRLPPELCTGSSMMPHKQNPDVLELIRASYHQMAAYEYEVKNIIGNLISGYNRDFQLTKKPMIKGFELTKETLDIITLVLSRLEVDKEKCKKAMTDELYATENMYNLVKHGVPFRTAYKETSQKYEKVEKKIHTNTRRKCTARITLLTHNQYGLRG
jgi:argininosuccinate lyase